MLKNALLEQERLFRKEYLASHSEKLSINDVNPFEVAFVQRGEKPNNRAIGFGRANVRIPMPDVPNLIDDPDVSISFGAKFKKQWEYALKAGQDEYDTMGKRYAFSTVTDKGINPYLSDGSIAPDTDRALAEYASKVASELSTAGYCFTGVKYSLFASGVLGNYGAIVDENGKMISTPREAMDWFAERPEMFQEIKYIPDEEGNLRELNSADLYDLPPGYIVLWAPEEGEQYAEEAGHIGITNGNGQAYGDHTDALHWEDYAKAEHGTFRVFKLNDANWNYNSEIEKLEYVGPETVKIKADRELTQKLNYNDRSEEAKLFSDTLDENKQLLMETLNLSEEDYDSYVKLAKAISIVETRAGNDSEMKLFDALENIPLVNRVATSVHGTLSAGMTQIKVSDFAPAEKKILEKLGVQTGDVNNIDDPKYSALATMVHINTLMKSYKAYLSNDDIGIIKDEKSLSPEESAILEKFKSVLSDGEQWNKIIEVKDVLQGKVEPSSPEIAELVEGAKLFVDTNVEKLDPEEYIAARWNGKRRTKSEKEASLNVYYDNMLQVHIDRTRMKMENGEKVDLPVGVLSSPNAYSYITAVKYNSKRV